MKLFSTPSRQPFARYVVAFVAGALITIPVVAGVITVLDRRGAMPPPLISNNICGDEKLAFMRKNRPGDDVNMLLVGSSSAMRHFNSREAVRVDPELRPYNAGLCAINLAQSERVIEWLTGRLPGVRRVLVFASSMEFGDCREGSRPWFDVRDADRFVFGDASRLGFYLKFFNASSLARNAIGLRRRRTDMTADDSFVFNEFGDAPVQSRAFQRRWFFNAGLDERCFTTLRHTAQALNARGIQFAVVESPMNPKWRQEFDRSGALTSHVRGRIREALGGTNAVFIEDRNGFPTADFYDAVHVQASSTPRFTRSVLSQLKGFERGTAKPSR